MLNVYCTFACQFLLVLYAPLQKLPFPALSSVGSVSTALAFVELSQVDDSEGLIFKKSFQVADMLYPEMELPKEA